MRIWEVTCERCTEGKTLCVDFDGTIASDAYPNIGDPMPGAKEVLTKLRSEGYYIILWTCRAGKTLAEARKWLKEKGIVVDAVNTNNPKDKFQGNPKVSADIYIDDRIVGGFPGWYRVYELITGKAFGMSESLMEAATKKTPGQIVADLLVKHKTPAKALDAITNAINVGTKRMSPESLLVHKEAKALLMKYSAGGAEMQKILQARIKGVGKPKAG